MEIIVGGRKHRDCEIACAIHQRSRAVSAPCQVWITKSIAGAEFCNSCGSGPMTNTAG